MYVCWERRERTKTLGKGNTTARRHPIGSIWPRGRLWGGGPAMFVVVGMSTTDTASGLRPLIPGVSVFTKSGPGPLHGTRPA